MKEKAAAGIVLGPAAGVGADLECNFGNSVMKAWPTGAFSVYVASMIRKACAVVVIGMP